MTHNWSVKKPIKKCVSIILVDFLMIFMFSQTHTALNHCKSNIPIGWQHSTYFNWIILPDQQIQVTLDEHHLQPRNLLTINFNVKLLLVFVLSCQNYSSIQI